MDKLLYRQSDTTTLIVFHFFFNYLNHNTVFRSTILKTTNTQLLDPNDFEHAKFLRNTKTIFLKDGPKLSYFLTA